MQELKREMTKNNQSLTQAVVVFPQSERQAAWKVNQALPKSPRRKVAVLDKISPSTWRDNT